jgi:hypothetical protein
MLLVKALIEHGARKILVLSSTRESGFKIDGWVHAVHPTVIKCDVGQVAEVRRVFDEHPNIRGVIHAAGVQNPSKAIDLLQAEDFDKVYRSKVYGARNLHECSPVALDFFVLLSSTASGFGSAGQANYAAADGALDELAVKRVQAGLPGLSCRLGAVAGGGMATASTLEMASRIGLLPLTASTTVESILRLMLGHRSGSGLGSVFTVCPLAPGNLPASPYFSEVALTAGNSSGLSKWALDLAGLDVAQRLCAVHKRLLELLDLMLVETAGRDEILEGATWAEAGMDSLQCIEFCSTIGSVFGGSQPPELLDRHPNLDALALHISGSLDCM